MPPMIASWNADGSPVWDQQVAPPQTSLIIPATSVMPFDDWAAIFARKKDVFPKCCDRLDRLLVTILRLYNNGFEGVDDGLDYLYALADALETHPDLDRHNHFEAIASEVRCSLVLYAKSQLRMEG